MVDGIVTGNRNLDDRYRELLLEPVRVCANYRPAFGTSRGEEEITLATFQRIFGADPLYSWLGLDSPLIYAAHKAAGGMTSIYRQIGIGCERLVRGVIQDALALNDAEVRWSYDSVRSDGRQQRMTLDARIDAGHVHAADAAARLIDWLDRCSRRVNQHRDTNGAVFEIRQGYKSADSKRQNADLRFGLAAYDAAYLPVILVISAQVSTTVVERYRRDKLLVLTGTLTSDDTQSTYAFFDRVVGYSLSAFFERNASLIRGEVTHILERLLSPG